MINEKVEVDAAGRRIELGISTLSEETAQLTGGDWDRKHVQQVKERRMRVRDGLEAPVSAAAVPAPTAPQPDPPLVDETKDEA